MKTAFLLLALLASHAHAIQIKDFVGSWSGLRRETLNGVGSQYSVTVEIVAANGGIVVDAAGDSPFIGPYKARQVYKKDGKFSEVLTTSGFVVASSKGTWRIKNGAIQINASGGNLEGETRISGILQIIEKARIKYKGSSNGSKVSFSLTRN